METTNTTEAPLHYNPNQLVTYKVIDSNGPDQTIQYPTEKVTQIEYALDESRRKSKTINNLQSNINQIIDNMTEEYWYNPDTDKETVLNELCEILDFNPVKTVEFTASLTVHGTIEIPISDAVDFDLDSYVYENMSIDSHTHTMEINDFDVDRVYEN